MMAETHTNAEVASAGTTKTSRQFTTPVAAQPTGVTLCLQYFRTAPGIIKIVELIFGIVCMACVAPAWNGGAHWFLFVVVTAFISTVIWSFIYMLNLKSAVNLPIDWLLTELLNTALTTLLYLIAVIVLFCNIGLYGGRGIPGGIFGVFNTLVYACGSFYLYRDWKDVHPHSSVSGSILKRNP